MQAAYPVADYEWTCSEQGWSVREGVGNRMLHNLDQAHETGLRNIVQNYINRGYKGGTYMTVGAYRWPTGESVVWTNYCLLFDPAAPTPGPDGYTTYETRSLPGDPWQ